MQLDVRVNVERYLSRKLDVVMRVDADTELPPFRFELLLSRPGVRLEGLQIRDLKGQFVDYSVDDGEIKFTSQYFEILYSVIVDYSDCVGVDRETEFNFPFVNENEIYFGTGFFPFPLNPHDSGQDIGLSFCVDNIPADWHVFSSLDAGELTSIKLDNFFWYANSKRKPQRIPLQGREKQVYFQILIQRGKEIPISAEEFSEFLAQYLNWLENNIAPYRQLTEINCLILQAPSNFKELTWNTSFATGENVINGIMAYGPDDPANYQMLGSPTYRDYLYEGIAHEIMHFYTTTAVQGKYKSVLYPDSNCPPAHARLIGESMNLYYVYQFVGDYLGDPSRLQNQLRSHLERAGKSARRNGLLDASILDQYLMQKGVSLLALFSAMVKLKQNETGPYLSGEFIFETLREKMGIEVSSEVKEFILGSEIPDYNSIIKL
jgi:hypothetical protein